MVNTNKTLIEGEVTRAKAAEKVNADAISAETARAKGAEQANTTAITAEATRAKGAEQANTDAITALDVKIAANTTAIATKVDKETGKGLSTNDFTTAEKDKLAGLTKYDDTDIKQAIEDNANAITDVDGKADANASEINSLQSTVDGHTTSISELRSDLTTGTTEIRSSINKLTTDLGAEATTARNAENRIDIKVDNIINNGPILPNGKSISARPTGSSDAPVDILTLTSDNKVELGSNIGQLILKSAGVPVLGVVDGQPKELALKEQIDALQNALNALTARVTALETPNP